MYSSLNVTSSNITNYDLIFKNDPPPIGIPDSILREWNVDISTDTISESI